MRFDELKIGDTYKIPYSSTVWKKETDNTATSFDKTVKINASNCLEVMPIDTISIGTLRTSICLGVGKNGVPVVKIDSDGSVFWHGNEVDSNDVFKEAMIDLSRVLHSNNGNTITPYSKKIKDLEKQIATLKRSRNMIDVDNSISVDKLKKLIEKGTMFKADIPVVGTISTNTPVVCKEVEKDPELDPKVQELKKIYEQRSYDAKRNLGDVVERNGWANPSSPLSRFVESLENSVIAKIKYLTTIGEL